MPDASSVRLRWALVQGFVDTINAHRAANVTPGDTLCVDESISRWYRLGGHWISVGLPAYVAIDRKPENGCKVQGAACGRSGIMLRLRLVTTAADEHANTPAAEAGIAHGGAILMRLVQPWAGSGRIVCADSYFASLDTAQFLLAAGMRFIGVVKTAHRKCPMASLSSREVQSSGSHLSIVHKDGSGRPDIMAVMWVDRPAIPRRHGIQCPCWISLDSYAMERGGGRLATRGALSATARGGRAVPRMMCAG